VQWRKWRCATGPRGCSEDSEDEGEPRQEGHHERRVPEECADTARASCASQASWREGSAELALVCRRWRDVSREAQLHIRSRRGRQCSPVQLARQLWLYPRLTSLVISPGSSLSL